MERIKVCKCCNLIPSPGYDYCLKCSNEILENIKIYNPQQFETYLKQTQEQIGVEIVE